MQEPAGVGAEPGKPGKNGSPVFFALPFQGFKKPPSVFGAYFLGYVERRRVFSQQGQDLPYQGRLPRAVFSGQGDSVSGAYQQFWEAPAAAAAEGQGPGGDEAEPVHTCVRSLQGDPLLAPQWNGTVFNLAIQAGKTVFHTFVKIRPCPVFAREPGQVDFSPAVVVFPVELLF